MVVRESNAALFLVGQNQPENNGFQIRAGVDLLFTELKNIRKENNRNQIASDWDTSPSFRHGLWEDFKEDFNLNSHDLLDIHKGGRERFDEVHTAVSHLKSTITLLSILKTTAEDILAPVEAELSRTGHTFGRLLGRLPQELLAITIRFACSDVYDLIAFSHVNRQFRNAALDVTELWSQVTSTMHPGILRLCLEKSKNAALSAIIDEQDDHYAVDGSYFPAEYPNPDERGSRFKNCVVETARCCARWEAMEINLPVDFYWPLDASTYIFNGILHKNFAFLNTPRLLSLSLADHGWIPDFDASTEDRAQILEQIHFYRAWKAPNLRELKFSGGVVPVSIPGASIETLSLDLRVDGRWTDFPLALHDLHAFLLGTPSLRKLELWTPSSGTFISDQKLDFSTIILHNMKEFALMVDYTSSPSDTTSLHLSSLVAKLGFPSLSSLSIKLAMRILDRNSGDLSAVMRSFIPLGCASHLESLSLFVFGGRCNLPTMSVALEQFPLLKTLSIGINGKLVVVPGASLHPNMRRSSSLGQLNLIAIKSGEDRFLEWLVEGLGDSGGHRKLKVAVRKCRSARFNMSHLLSLIPKENLTFEGGAIDDLNGRWDCYGFYEGDGFF